MKINTIFKIGAIAFILFWASRASAQQDSSVSLQVALPEVTGYTGGAAIIASYRIPAKQLMSNLSQNIGFEGEFTSTRLSKPYVDSIYNSVNMSYDTLAAYAVFSKYILSDLRIKGRAGLLFESIAIKSDYNYITDTGVGLSFGVGVIYEIFDTVDFIIEYTFIESDIAHLSTGIGFLF